MELKIWKQKTNIKLSWDAWWLCYSRGIVAPFTMKGTLTVVGDHKCVFKLENGKKFLFDTEKIDLESITVIE